MDATLDELVAEDGHRGRCFSDLIRGASIPVWLEAPAVGVYRIVATSFEQRGTGAYTLTIRAVRVSPHGARSPSVR